MGERRKAIEGRLARLREMYEMRDVSRKEYAARRERLNAELADLVAPERSELAKAGDTISSLVDDWEAIDAGQRRQVRETIFSDVRLDDGQLVAATPRAGWLPTWNRR